MPLPPDQKSEFVSISLLLQRLAYSHTLQTPVSAEEIASAFALILENQVSDIQTAALLTLLHSTGKDKEADVIAQCSRRTRDAACQIDKDTLEKAIKIHSKKEGTYRGGLCDIVGTGGDSHSSFNISTTASIIASSLVLVAKHGNRAQTSFSGAADILNAIAPVSPKITAVKAENVAKLYEQSTYGFLFAPNFHSGAMYANPVRRQLGLRTIFNFMGPLANPIDWALEARLVGVASQSLGPVFIEALQQSGAKKALVVCGEEDIDEISCAGKTNCWRLSEYPNPEYEKLRSELRSEEAVTSTLVKSETFQLHPSDFGLPTHPLTDVCGKKMPEDNAAKLMSILRNELPRNDPILDFVLINVAALFVVSGICESDTSSMGPGDTGRVVTERGPGSGRWKEGVRRARWTIESGQALKSFQQFIEVTNALQ